MFERYYKFADKVFLLSCEEKFECDCRMSEFECDTRNADYKVIASFTSHIPTLQSGGIKHREIYRLYDGEKRCTLRHFDIASEPMFYYVESTKVKTDIVFSDYYRGKLTARLIFDSAGLFEILQGFDMTVLHSSFIIKNGQAVLFTGESGIGKSTQAALWEKYGGAVTVNGDRTLIDCGNMTANGIFYSGTSGICRNMSAPIAAVVILGKAKENILKKARGAEAFKTILNQSSFHTFDPRCAGVAADLAAEIAGGVPVYRFDCLPDISAFETLSGELWKKGET